MGEEKGEGGSEEEKKDDVVITGVDARGNTIRENVQVLSSEEEKHEVEYEIREARTELESDVYMLRCIKVNGAIFKTIMEETIDGVWYRIKPSCYLLTDKEVCKICAESGKVVDKGVGYFAEVEDAIWLLNTADKAIAWIDKSEIKEKDNE